MHVRPRRPLSLSTACARARDLVGAEALAEAIGRSISIVNAWCDPERNNLPSLRQALEVDRLCMSAAGQRPVTETLVALTSVAPVTNRPPVHLVLRLTSEVGDIASALDEALSDSRISPTEADRLSREIAEARAALEALERRLAREVGDA